MKKISIALFIGLFAFVAANAQMKEGKIVYERKINMWKMITDPEFQSLELLNLNYYSMIKQVYFVLYPRTKHPIHLPTTAEKEEEGLLLFVCLKPPPIPISMLKCNTSQDLCLKKHF